MFVVLLLALLSVASGFLLDGSNNKTVSGSEGNCISKSEFLYQKQLLQRNIEDLHHDVDQTFATLTTQLKDKITDLETKLTASENKGVNSSNLVTLTEYLNLERKFYDLKNLTSRLQQENDILKLGQSIAWNETEALKKEVAKLKQVGALDPRQEIFNMKQTVADLVLSVNTIKATDLARSQDLMGLISKLNNIESNQTKQTDELNAKLNGLKMSVEQQIQNEIRDNVKMYVNLTKFIDESETKANTTYGLFYQKLDEVEQFYNLSIQSIQREINGNETVALTAFPSQNAVTPSSAIKFDQVSFSVGITDLLSLTSTGKFTCEIPGLYLIAVSIASTNDYPYFCTLLNAAKISCTDIGQQTAKAGHFHTGSTVIIRNLVRGDVVWVKAESDKLTSVESGEWSQFTVVKIK